MGLGKLLWDHLEVRLNLLELLPMVHEVHTISSLSGFEAILRNRKVVCYGTPFYAGWGLTIDRHTCKRRTQKLTLYELIFHALISYPKYIHPATGRLAEPEEVIAEIHRISLTRKNLIKKFKYIAMKTLFYAKSIKSSGK